MLAPLHADFWRNRFGFTLAVACCIHLSAAFGQTQVPTATTPNQAAKAEFVYRVIRVEGSGFGYDIYANGKMLVHQPHIPGLAGNVTFATKHDAEKVAELVVKKLKNGELPPVISEEELRRLQVIH